MKRKYELLYYVSLHNLNSKHFHFLYKSRTSIIINHQQYINDNIMTIEQRALIFYQSKLKISREPSSL